MSISRIHSPTAGLIIYVSGFLLYGMGGGAAYAAPRNVNGCQLLATAIQHSVTQALRSPYSMPVLDQDTFLPLNEPSICGTATATASRAFSKALRFAGIEVSWNDGEPIDPGDYCLSHYVDHCYPRPNVTPFSDPSYDTPLVNLAWATVVAGVRQRMPSGTQSDIAYFEPSRLEETLRLNLDVTLRVSRAGLGRYEALIPD